MILPGNVLSGPFYESLPLKPGTVAHTCNPSYLGGGDQEDQGSKPAWARPHPN
jgi:hypothetical protein